MRDWELTESFGMIFGVNCLHQGGGPPNPVLLWREAGRSLGVSVVPPCSPLSGLEGGRRSGLTPPKKLLVMKEEGRLLNPARRSLGG